ncbi:MAG: hypothetical protein QME74_00720 [Candidatus Edwardsbacteria bacterium]|nr:hypothetical protein [Candidatus Edwardsbacteria bacterium]
MKTAADQVLLGVRVSAALKGKLTGYCDQHGIKMNHLVAEAIREKLEELAEDAHDLSTARARMADGQYLAGTTLNGYLKKRGIKKPCSR